MIVTATSSPKTAGATHRQYGAFGLLIRSDLELPELEPRSFGEPSLTVRRGGVGRPLPDDFPRFEFDETEQYLAWPRVGHFLVTASGTEVRAEAGPEIEERFLNLALLGPVMATLLQLRGHLVLHGSAVEIGGQAVVFLGDKEAGKSTTAAAFAAAGRPLLTDDVVAIDLTTPNAPLVMPGYPQMKLSASAAERFSGIESTALPRPHVSFEKERLRLSGAFPEQPVPLAAVYVLARATDAEVTPLETLEGMKALMRFSYSTRFGDRLIRGQAAAAHMAHCAALAGANPVCRLDTPSTLARLPEVVDRVVAHVRG